MVQWAGNVCVCVLGGGVVEHGLYVNGAVGRQHGREECAVCVCNV